MKQQIYLLRDKVAQSYVRAFDASNDATAVRYIVDVYGKQPHYSDLELVRFGVAYDVQTGDKSDVERAVVALPVQPVEPRPQDMANMAQ